MTLPAVTSPGVTTLGVINSDGAGPGRASYSYTTSDSFMVSPSYGPMQGRTPVTITGAALAVGSVT